MTFFRKTYYRKLFEKKSRHHPFFLMLAPKTKLGEGERAKLGEGERAKLGKGERISGP